MSKNILCLILMLIFLTAGCSIISNRVSEPVFSPGSGNYTNSVTVTVSCPTLDSTIYVKRDVTFYSNQNLNLPPAVQTSDSWTEYYSPLTFRTNTLYVVVRVLLYAYATVEGLEPSSTNSATYYLYK